MKLRPLVQKQLYAEVDRRLEELREERHRIREAEKASSARIQARGGQPMARRSGYNTGDKTKIKGG